MSKLSVSGTHLCLDGQPTLFVGYSNYGLVYHPEMADLDPADNDLGRWLDHLESHGINLLREWVAPLPEEWGKALQPVRKINGRYDFTKLNPAFWAFFHRLADAAAARKMILEVTVFDRYSMEKQTFDTHPMNTTLGGFVPASNGDAFPQFYTNAAILEQTEAYAKLVLAELARHPNILIEPINEPAERGAGPAAVSQWHARFYQWAAAAAPGLLLAPNLIYAGPPDDPASVLYPNPAHPAVKVVSIHAGPTTWLPDDVSLPADIAKGVQLKVQREVARFGKPLIIDTDGAHSGPKSRDDNRRLWLYCLGAARGGAAAFNHRDPEPYGLTSDPKDVTEPVDEQALDALDMARKQLEGKLPPPPGGTKLYPHPIAESFDYAAGNAGDGHLVSTTGGQTFYSHFTGAGWQGPTLLTRVTGLDPSGRFNLPRIAQIGDTTFVVFGHAPVKNNGLAVVSRTGAGAWSSPTAFAGKPGSVVEYFDVTVDDGKLCVVTSEDAGNGLYEARLYVLANGKTREVLLGTGPAKEPAAARPYPQDWPRLAAAYHFKNLSLFVVKGAEVHASFDSDLGGTSAGATALAFDGAGNPALAHIPFGPIAEDMWHPYSVYPTSLRFKAHVPGPAEVLEAFDPYHHTTFQPSLTFGKFGAALVAADKDGLALVFRVYPGFPTVRTVVGAGWRPLMARRIDASGTWWIDVVVSGGASGVFSTPIAATASAQPEPGPDDLFS
jgi:hypothetical protein